MASKRVFGAPAHPYTRAVRRLAPGKNFAFDSQGGLAARLRRITRRLHGNVDLAHQPRRMYYGFMVGAHAIEATAAAVIPTLAFVLNWRVRAKNGYALSAAADAALAIAAFDLAALVSRVRRPCSRSS